MIDTLTIRGFVGNDPQSTTTNGGTPVLNFRVGSSQRRYDAKNDTWVDMGTNWYAVSAYRQLADHARASLRKGDAVIVSGRLKLREWESTSGQRGASLDLDADAIGHDLRWGTSNFMKTQRPLTAVAASGATPGGQDADERDQDSAPGDTVDAAQFQQLLGELGGGADSGTEAEPDSWTTQESSAS